MPWRYDSVLQEQIDQGPWKVCKRDHQNSVKCNFGGDFGHSISKSLKGFFCFLICLLGFSVPVWLTVLATFFARP